ncbi:hypothetical protein GJ744_004926 [Endocarpon pusillum]|uniref:T6SS Phospholipase effector Tle1-like catalytic domain-containing protein n=1 Tax=Endocarpon pusillum TaxID=364733 RepID=A0A8H7E951_9EURO|nr:hypothetical protein GJ744_004926 [Endocarpon pusillum]
MSLVPPHPAAYGPPPPRASAAPPGYGQSGSPYVASSPVGPRKRLIATCDGTWLDADSGLKNGQRQPPSNVSHFGWAVKDTSSDGIAQVVHYQAGVGTSGGILSRVVGGATGDGLEENVRETYSFLAINYRDGDEIFLLGFSRGAWTARSVAGMIGALGLLTRQGLPMFPEIYKDFKHRSDLTYVPRWPDIPFPDKPSFDEPAYVAELQRRGLTRTNVPIKAVGVWDTVGSLGIPVPLPGIFGRLGIGRLSKEYSFYDTSLHVRIENAFQALALDEQRAPFAPALWEKPRGSTTNLKQVWFPGVHSNVGGGYDDADLANITLAWMMSRMEPFIDFRPDYMMQLYQKNKQHYRASGQRSRSWSFGEIPDSMMGIYALAGKRTRTPGNYFRTDPHNGRTTSKRLKNTNEYIHASVRSRVGLGGPGVQDRGRYDCKALKDWSFELDPQSADAKEPMVVWKNMSGRKEGQMVIPEAALLETERRLLEMSSKVEDYVLDMREPRRSRSRR